MVSLQIVTFIVTFSFFVAAQAPSHQAANSRGRDKTSAQALTKPQIEEFIKRHGILATRQALVVDAHALLSNVVDLGCPGPGLSASDLHDKLAFYFAKPPRLRSSTQLKLLQAVLKWLCDSGYEFGGMVHRSPIATAMESIQLAEDWVFGEFVRSEYDVDVLHQAAVQQTDIPKEKLPLFLDYLARSGRLQSLTQKVLQGPHGQKAFEAARDRIELLRLKSADPNLKMGAAEKKHFDELSQRVSENGKKDIGIFLYFGDVQDDFMKTRDGVQLRGEPFHPFDADKEWKKTFLKDRLKSLNIDPKIEDKIVRDFVDTENYPVNAVKRLSEYIQLLVASPPRGLGLSHQKLTEKVEAYRRRPPKDPRGVERMETAWRMVNNYASAWLVKGGARIFERDILSYASPDEFNRILSIVDVYSSISKREFDEKKNPTVDLKIYVGRQDLHAMTEPEFRKQPWEQQKAAYLSHLKSWRTQYESLSPFSWRGEPEKLENFDSRTCEEQVRDFVSRAPKLRPDEVEIALKAICKDKIPEMLKWYQRQRERNSLIKGRYRDLQELLDRTVSFVLASDKELGKLADIDPGGCKETDFHAANCLSALRTRSDGIIGFRTKAEYLLLALRSAEVDPLLKDSASLESVRLLAERLVKLVELSKSIQGNDSPALQRSWKTTIALPASQVAKDRRLFDVGFCSELPAGSLKWSPKAQAPGTDSPPSKDGGQSSEQAAFDAGVSQRNKEYQKQYTDLNNFLVKEIESAAGKEKAFIQEFDQRNSARLQSALATLEGRTAAVTHQVSRQRELTDALEPFSKGVRSGRSSMVREWEKFSELERIIVDAVPRDDEDRANLEMARLSRDAASLARARGDRELAGQYADVGTVFGRVASGISDHKRLIIGLTPGIGFAQDFLELVTGFDIDNNRLDGVDRGFAALGVLSGGLGSKLKIPAKAAAEMLQARKTLSGGALPKAIDAATRALETKKIFVEGSNVKRAFKIDKVVETDALNAEQVLVGRQPPYASGRTATELRTVGEQRFVRVYSEADKFPGAYITRAETVAGKSPAEVKALLNLKDEPKYMTDVILPDNSRLLRSPIGKNDFGQGEGKIQYQILDELKASFFRNQRLIEVSPPK